MPLFPTTAWRSTGCQRVRSRRPATLFLGDDRMAERIQISADDARQGVTGHNVRYVLFWGLGLAIVVLAVAYYFAFG